MKKYISKKIVGIFALSGMLASQQMQAFDWGCVTRTIDYIVGVKTANNASDWRNIYEEINRIYAPKQETTNKVKPIIFMEVAVEFIRNEAKKKAKQLEEKERLEKINSQKPPVKNNNKKQIIDPTKTLTEKETTRYVGDLENIILGQSKNNSQNNIKKLELALKKLPISQLKQVLSAYDNELLKRTKGTIFASTVEQFYVKAGLIKKQVKPKNKKVSTKKNVAKFLEQLKKRKQK